MRDGSLRLRDLDPAAQDGSSFSQHSFSTTRETYAAAASKVLPPGTFNVGMCVRNNGSSTINNNYVNGWVMVTS